MKRSLLIIFSFFVYSLVTFSQSFYVSTTGYDAPYRGSYSLPLATINYALGRRDTNSAGLVITVMPGNYYQSISIPKVYKYFPITIQANDTSNKPIFRGNTSSFIGPTSVFTWSSSVNYVTLYGIKIKSATKTDSLRGIWIKGNYNTIRYCELDSINRSGIAIQGNGNVVEYNYIHNILGSNGKEGNNIDIETIYRGNNNRVAADSNIIQYNILTDNSSHFGVNLFPFKTDPNQPPMLENIIRYNYIKNTGGGIYCRYQKNLDIIGNVIVQNHSTATTQGGGILFDQNSDYPKVVDTSNIKILNNTIADNQAFGIENSSHKNVFIKNNIISNNGGWHIEFVKFTNDTSTHIDNNLYYGNQTWKWGSGSYLPNFNAWKDSTKFDSLGVNDDPQFQTNSYTLQYGSPAKNAGRGLNSDGVNRDIIGNIRPYWNKDYDIGAYEVVEDAHLKIGLAEDPSQVVSFILTSLGTYWERNSAGSFNISQQAFYSSSTCKVNWADPNLNDWKGWNFGWISSTTSDSNNIFAQGIYKLTYGPDTSKFIYIDYRDGINSYSPIVNIEYNISNPENKRFEYFLDTAFRPVENGSVIRVWDIKNNGVSNTAALNNFWNNSLVWTNKDNHPFLIFGPYTNPSNVLNYDFYKILDIGGYDWAYFERSDSSLSYPDSSENLILGRFTHNVAYKVIANLETGSPSEVSSDSIVVRVNGGNLKQNNADIYNIPEIYSLSQNYPNPFNPNTSVKYSIKDAGFVKLQVYNILGQEIKVLVNEFKLPGNYEINFNGGNLSSGTYFYKLSAGTYTQIKKMQILK